MTMDSRIRKIREGNIEELSKLYEDFKPLIYVWLRKTGELYKNQREDFESSAKILLIEATREWESSRGVPFESYYKIKLWNWYGNHRKKKRVECVELTDQIFEKEGEQFHLEKQEQRDQFKKTLEILSEVEKKILLRFCEGFTIKQISEELKLDSKKISQIKYDAIRKMRNSVRKMNE